MKPMPDIDDKTLDRSIDSLVLFATELLAWFFDSEPMLRKNRVWSHTEFMRTLLSKVINKTVTLQELAGLPMNMAVLRNVQRKCEQSELRRATPLQILN